MDSAKKAVIRLRSSNNGSYLVACPDKKSVAHVALGNSGGGLTSIENALWVVTRFPDSSDRDKQVCFMSVYGKLLAAPLSSPNGNFAYQMDVPKDGISSKVQGHAIRWKFEKTEQGVTDVYVRPSVDQGRDDLYLMASTESNVVLVPILFWPFSWPFKGLSRWVIEVAETSSTVNFVQQSRNHNHQVRTPSFLVGQLVINNPAIYAQGASKGGAVGSTLNINSGSNVNHGSGTQTNGDVNVITEIGRQEYIVNFINM